MQLLVRNRLQAKLKSPEKGSFAAGIEHLLSLKRLTSLSLSNTAVTSEGLDKLTALTSLRELRVANTPIAAEGMRGSGQGIMSSLTSLDMSHWCALHVPYMHAHTILVVSTALHVCMP